MTLAAALSKSGEKIKELCIVLQQDIITRLLKFETSQSFHQDSWVRDHNSGGGISCVLENGSVFDKAGVNVSSIKGKMKKKSPCLIN